MPLIRNIQGKPLPLIMHRRLRLLRRFDRAVRFWFCVFTFRGMKYRLPRYERSRQTPEQQAAELEACRTFLGSRSPNPEVARRYQERARQSLLVRSPIPAETLRSCVY